MNFNQYCWKKWIRNTNPPLLIKIVWWIEYNLSKKIRDEIQEEVMLNDKHCMEMEQNRAEYMVNFVPEGKEIPQGGIYTPSKINDWWQ